MKKQKSILMLMFGLIVMFGMTSCSTENVPEGFRGVLVKRPYIFGSSGVEILSNDRHVIASSSTVIMVDIQPIKIKEIFDDLVPHDDTPVDLEVYFNLVNDERKLDTLYIKFGLQYYEKNLQQKFRELVRNKCKEYDMKVLTTDTKVSQEIAKYIEVEGNKIIQKAGIPVLLTDVSIGSINPPPSVKEEREKTAAAKQREVTQVQETKNQVERQNTERERAKADREYQTALGLTKDEYIEILDIKAKEKAYEKADNVTIIEGNPTLTKEVK